MVFLGFLSRSIRIFPLIFRLWLLVVENLHKEGDGNTLELGPLTFLIDPIFLQVQNIPHIYELLLQLQVMRNIFTVSIEAD